MANRESRTQNQIIDIPLDGVGVEGRGSKKDSCGTSRSPIDIPLGKERKGGAADTKNIEMLEMEMVNRHHAEIKELHRKARQGEL